MKNNHAKRPFRLWNTKEKRDEPHRYYLERERAENAAVRLLHRAFLYTTLEVYDLRTGKHLATYRRGLKSIELPYKAEREAHYAVE